MAKKKTRTKRKARIYRSINGLRWKLDSHGSYAWFSPKPGGADKDGSPFDPGSESLNYTGSKEDEKRWGKFRRYSQVAGR